MPEFTPPASKRSRTHAWRRAAVAGAAAALAAAPLLATTPAQASTANGCSYGTGGPLASSLCWIDLSDFGTMTGDELRGNTITKPMTVDIGGYSASFDITVSAGPTGSVGVTSAAFGTDIWSRAILGNTIDGTPYYAGTTGQPALYELADATSPYAVAGPRETVTLHDLVITNAKGQPITDYSLVMTDAESTNTGEGFVWTSDVPLNNLQEVVPAAGNKITGNTNAPYGDPCNSLLSGFGTTTVTCQSTLIPGETSSSARGIVMVQAAGATSVSAQITGRGGSGRQGIAFAIALPPIADDSQVTINPNQTATLDPFVRPGTKPISGVAFDNGTTTKTVPGEGTWSINLTGGQPVATFTPEKDYDGPVTPQPYTVTDENGATATGTLTVTINTPPATGDAHRTIDPNQTATLTPTTTPGTGTITAVTFDNGTTTKTVPGEGTWNIALSNGQPVSTFTPEKDYHGAVTPQPYTVTDSNGLSANGTLSVDITAPATVGVTPTGSPTAAPVAQGPVAPIAAMVNTGGSLVSAAPATGWVLTSVAGILLLATTLLVWWRRTTRRA